MDAVSVAKKQMPVIFFSGAEERSSQILKCEGEIISKAFHVVFLEELSSDPSLLLRVQGLIVVPSAASVNIANEMLPDLPNLKAIVTWSAGYDHLITFKDCGLPLANCPGGNTEATADHTLAFLLSSGCGLPPFIRAAARADKPLRLAPTYRKPGVTGTTLGIFGMGSLGSAIARRAHGFQMTILYHSRTRKSAEEEAALQATYVPSLDEMLPRCDFVVASCNLNDTTRHAFGRPQFQLMKSSAIFINISRGQVVDQDALVSALESGEISGAALDVTDPIPLPPHHPLMKMENVIVTPHMAGLTSKGLRFCLHILKKNFEAAIIHGQPMPNELTF